MTRTLLAILVLLISGCTVTVSGYVEKGWKPEDVKSRVAIEAKRDFK